MAVSEQIRRQFAEAHGVSLEELNESGAKSLMSVCKGRRESEVEGAGDGRGYVNFGKNISASEKDDKNFSLLKHW